MKSLLSKDINVPGELEGFRAGDGVRSAALAHAVQLVQRNIKAEEELQGVFGDGSGACVALAAAVQAQGLTHLLEHKLFGYLIAERRAASCCTSEKRQKKTLSLSFRSHFSSTYFTLK